MADRRGIFGAPMAQKPIHRIMRREPDLKPYDAPWRDDVAKTVSGWAGRLGANERNVYQNTRKALGVADWIPGIGDAAAAVDAANSFRAGDYLRGAGETAVAAVGLVPGVGDVAAAGGRAALKKLPKVAFSKGYQQVALGDTLIDLATRANGTVDVSKVFTPVNARGKGSARAAMNHLAQQADAQGVRLELTADPLDRATSKAGLENFYKSLGFVPNKGRNKDYETRAGMIRPVDNGRR